MKEVTLRIPDKEYSFFMKLVKNLGFVSIEKEDKGDSKEEIIQNLKSGLEEMKQYKAGQKQATSLNDFLDEL